MKKNSILMPSFRNYLRIVVFRLSYKSSFVAAMKLREVAGPCGKLHGHTYEVEATIKGNELNKDGMIYDYHILRDKINNIISKLDHIYLNELEYFRNVQPTSENIAKYIFTQLDEEILETSIAIESITIVEDRNVRISYSED